MSDMNQDLQDLRDERAELEAELEDANAATKKALEFSIRELDRQIKNLEDDLAQEEEREKLEALSESPEGRLVWAICDAMQYDYLGQDDLPAVLEYVHNDLAKHGLVLRVVPSSE